MQTKRLWSGFAATLMLLSACGGSGGGAGPVVLSGTIAVAETAQVDSDTNDVNQTDRSANNSTNAAQPLLSPLLLVGAVNQPSTGPEGSNYASGDVDDFFRVDLVAGQVVELEFAADPSSSDVDLYLLNTSGTQVGESSRQDTRFECVSVTTTGSYYVNVHAFRGASIYNLRIGAPGSAGACAQQTTALDFSPDELLAKPRANAEAQTEGIQRQAGVTVVARGGEAGPRLLRLPATASERAQRLRALSAGSKTLSKSYAVAPPDDAVPAALTTLRYAKALRASGAYAYAEPNWMLRRHALVGSYPPADRNYPYQRWHYEQINLPAAMDRINALATQPAQRPVVAVIDDGVMLNHPDFSGQLFSNGRAFVSSTADTGPRDSGDDISRAQDSPVFHGTHVAGTVAAATFEPGGGAGVAPMAQIMPLRVFSPTTGGASSFDVIQAMRYAARLSNSSGALPTRRADVINLSLGSDRACLDSYRSEIAQVRAAGTVVVASAGNSARNDLGQAVAVGSPANCAGVIAVGATDARKRLAFYSTRGALLTVAGPGGDSRQSTTGTGAPDAVYSDLGTFDAAGVRQPSFGGMMGTSMAAPHVAGVIALMRYVNPALSPEQIDALMSAGSLTDDLGAAGRDDSFGWGLINARKAVDAALIATGTPPPVPPVLIQASPSTLDFGSFQTEASFELVAEGVTAESVLSVAADSPAVTVVPVSGAMGQGRYRVTVDRALLGPAGSYFPRITVMLSPSRNLVIQLSITVPAVAGQQRVGNYGPVYVLLMDPDTLDVLHTVLATRTASGYSWAFSGFSRPKVAIIAGGDLDNDDVICQRGEPCGGYPVLTSTGDLTSIDVTGSRSDLNFQVAPLSGISAQSVAVRDGGFRRTPLVSAVRSEP